MFFHNGYNVKSVCASKKPKCIKLTISRIKLAFLTLIKRHTVHFLQRSQATLWYEKYNCVLGAISQH